MNRFYLQSHFSLDVTVGESANVTWYIEGKAIPRGGIRSHDMWKLKLALLLPIVQLSLAVTLLYWPDNSPPTHMPTTRLVCWGLNAPALLFRVQAVWGPLSSLMPGSIWGADTSDLLFLVGITMVWGLVGHAGDQAFTGSAAPRHSVAASLTLHMGLLALAILLLLLGLDEMQYFQANNANYPVAAILTWIWSAGLLFFSGRSLVKHLRRLRRIH